MNIIIAGDFAPYGRVGEMFRLGAQNELLEKDVLDKIKEADYRIINLEAPIVNGNCDRQIPYKINLSASEKVVKWLKETGFDCATLANNHIRDYCDEGVVNSLMELDNYGISRVGAGKDLQSAKAVLYRQINDRKFAIINVCENEFSVADSRPGAAPLDMIDNYHQIIQAKNNADYVIMIVHGGHEQYQLPSPRMKKTYEWFVDLGADAIINHHQHCFSGIESYKGKPIFYGIGNFCFDWPGRVGSDWNYGFMVNLTLEKDISYDIIPYCQCDKEPVVRLLDSEEEITFNKKLNEINSIIKDDTELAVAFAKYCRSRYKGMELALSPYSSRVLKGLFMRRLLPSFVTDSRRFFLYDYVNCEAHRDVLLDYLKNEGNW